MNDITRILSELRSGTPGAGDRFFEWVYAELRELAARKLANEAPGQTLQPTALVHEAWLRLGADAQPHWQNRGHFFGAAAEAMRRILVDRARRKLAQRRGAGADHVELESITIPEPEGENEALVRLDEALERFARLDPMKAELVKLRYFVGLTMEEAAGLLNISEPTAKRWWAYSKAWLYAACREGGKWGQI